MMSSYIHEHACSGIVTVIVSPEGRPFFFHESLLCEKSPWFRAQLHNQKTEEYSASAIELSPIETSFRDFQQSQRKIIYRYEDEVHTFNQFFTWIYGCVYAMPGRDPETYDTATHISEWVILYVLAVEMGVMDLAHKALWEYVHCRDTLRTGYWMPLPSEIQYIYHNRANAHDLRNLIVEKVRSLLFSIRFDGMNRQLSSLCHSHPGFNTDVFEEIQRHSEQASVCNYGDCSMHVSRYASLSDCASSDSYFEVESPIPPSVCLDAISDLELDDAEPSLISDSGTVSAEEEDVYSREERDEAMAEYYETRDLASYVF
ncbi:aa9bb043-f5f5-4492-8ee0-7ffd932e0b08 [Sclerotinia trifoliorum]|uniref:73132fe9-5342-4359-a638-fab1bb434e69 n=1 Tax=Sclerotinia trifoliorum TaxID=28548 RepID=A0A8H2VSX8_9HELO|nr:73132fe9-5342-4359-a638-fab1bb434e69 [Sclerotinia trifoliorum]CAD6453401.1 aa9bb043-f5f5-4492-8ee0-7ffd932e0b08 [Sclerotinia trifoliorum]